MRIEEYIEEALVDVMQARSYISTNSVPVKRYKDHEDFRGNEALVIKSNPSSRIAPNADFFEVQVDMMAISRRQEDMKGKRIDDIFAEIKDEIEVKQSNTPSVLQAAINAAYPSSGITIDGIVPIEGNEVGEVIFVQAASMNVYLTYVTPTT